MDVSDAAPAAWSASEVSEAEAGVLSGSVETWPSSEAAVSSTSGVPAGWSWPVIGSAGLEKREANAGVSIR